ncbi:hypothetical protein ACFVT8_17780 [Lysinibacillus sp. NPDC058147]
MALQKKVSLTLTKEDWEQFNAKVKGNHSLFLRKIFAKALSEGDTGDFI